MAQYRGAVIGLGWMGLLYDLAGRIGTWHVDDIDRPTPKLNVHRRFHLHDRYKGSRYSPISYSEALWDRPEIDLVAGAERDKKRLAAFGERYGIEALYTDAEEMLRRERPDVVAISTNTKSRPALTCAAVECGAKAIITAKPMARSLAEADRMVESCADARVPLCCGAISVNHPSFARAKELIKDGTIGTVVSIEAESDQNLSQHQNWSYFVDSRPAWVIAVGDKPQRETGSNEFEGQGMMVTDSGLVVHFRMGAPALRVTGTSGELGHPKHYAPWSLYQDMDTVAGRRRVQIPWPEPQMDNDATVTHGLADIIDCLAGKLDKPKNSGRRVAIALEVEIAMKISAAQGGRRIDLPLSDRSLCLEYDWHR